MTYEPKFGERKPPEEPIRHQKRNEPMTPAAWVVLGFILLAVGAIVTPLIIGLWRWSFSL